MKVTLYPGKLTGEHHVIASKSMSHRALIAAGLAEGKSTLKNLLDSDDIRATKEALACLGVNINQDHVFGGHLQVKTPIINARESGSTLRFMIPVALLLDQPITFIGEGRLPQRPLGLYEDLLSSSVTLKRLNKDALPLEVKGPLKPGNYTLPGHISSQFITGLLLTLPLLDYPSTLTLSTPLESKGYVDLTLDILHQSGIEIIEENNTYKIPGNQCYKPIHVTIEGDYSQAAFFIVGALLSGPITFYQLNKASKQGDKAILDIIEQMGAKIIDHDDHHFTVYPSPLKETTINLSHIPDLGPVLMILAGLVPGKTVFKQVNRLRLKESDRLAVMIEVLTHLGVQTSLTDDTLTVYGVETFKGNLTFSSYNDHRIVMALSIAALKADGPLTVLDALVINKSYPSFFDDYIKLGGQVLSHKEG